MNTKRLNIKLDSDTHQKLKMEAVRGTTTIQALIVHLIKQLVYRTQKDE